MPKFGTKNDILGIFDQKPVVIFEISTLEFVKLQIFAKKQNCLNFGRKMLYLGIFGVEFWKTIVIFEISTCASV